MDQTIKNTHAPICIFICELLANEANECLREFNYGFHLELGQQSRVHTVLTHGSYQY